MQTKAMSAVEAATSTVAGFLVSLVLTFTVLPAFGYPVTPSHGIGITAIYTVASVVRSYAVRRVFNG